MILVTLGTQDKDFSRLLKAVDKQIEAGVIKEKVIVQAGSTSYKSKNMKIFDLMSTDEFESLLSKCSLVITHGGVGTILSALKKDKKVIAASRLAKYGEHHNDHQKQVVKEFAKRGYILELKDFNKLGKLIEKSKTFKPKKYKSNTVNMVNLLDNYIQEDNHTSWFNKLRGARRYLFIGLLMSALNIISFNLLMKNNISLYISNLFAWFITFVCAFIINQIVVYKKLSLSKSSIFKKLLLFGVISLIIDSGFMYLFSHLLVIDKIISKVLINFVLVIINYLFYKSIVFKK
ncbi:MAG: hypothetical protein E7160_04090 [Firmicutes bacterium]|nr:hypothetical protein [Bacillota bacterium]